MVTCIPEAPKFATGSEREVWELLKGSLRPEDILFANQPNFGAGVVAPYAHEPHDAC